MKSIYFLSINMISFVPYAFGMLKSYAEKDPDIAAAYRWHEPITDPAPVEKVVAAVEDPDLLCLSCYVWNHNQQMAIAKRVKACQYIQWNLRVAMPDIGNRNRQIFGISAMTIYTYTAGRVT